MSLSQALPLEIILLILETLALDFPETARGLVLVSKVVQRCVDPILYQTVLLTSRARADAFARTISAPHACINKRPSFFQDFVKCVSFEHFYEPHNVDIITRTCTGLHSLQLLDNDGIDDESVEIDWTRLGHLPLRRLVAAHWEGRRGPSLLSLLQKPLFVKLERLELSVEYVRYQDIQIPKSLPHLIHFALLIGMDFESGHFSEEDIQFFSNTLPTQLHVCLFEFMSVPYVLWELTSCLKGTCNHDPRIVFAFSKSDMQTTRVTEAFRTHCVLRSDPDWRPSRWERLRAGEKDVWALAEDVIRERRKKIQH